MTSNRPTGITTVAVLMVVFGLAEIATGITHNFLDLISTTAGTAATYGGVVIGVLYLIAGVLLFPMRKDAMWFSLVCLALVILGRIELVLIGLYPLNSFLQTFSIIVGTALAAIFAFYIWLKRERFR